jgi:hypothetical protein
MMRIVKRTEREASTSRNATHISLKGRPLMLTKSMAAKIAKFAALLGLFGLTVVIDTCSSRDQGDKTARPARTYYYGGPYW